VQRLDEQLEKGSGALHTQMKKQQTLCDAKKKTKTKTKKQEFAPSALQSCIYIFFTEVLVQQMNEAWVDLQSSYQHSLPSPSTQNGC
jgi:hypothetical protein